MKMTFAVKFASAISVLFFVREFEYYFSRSQRGLIMLRGNMAPATWRRFRLVPTKYTLTAVYAIY